LDTRYQEAEAESRAGYEILSKQPSAPERWMQIARTDLARESEALRKAAKTASFHSGNVETNNSRSAR
jgi:hypothetical protein